MSKKQGFIWLALVVVLFSGCHQRSAGEELVGPGIAKEPAIENIDLVGPVELESISINAGGIFIKTSHTDYGQDLIDLELLANFMPNLVIKSTGEDSFSFILDERVVDVITSSNLYYVDDIEFRAGGPSFYHEGSTYVNAKLLLDLGDGIKQSEEGLILNESIGNPSEMVGLSDFKGTLGHMTLVNKDYPIDKDATGKDLVNLNKTYPGWVYTKDDMVLEEVAAAQMIKMLEAMEDMEKVYVVSTYRSYDYQQGLFNRKIKQYMSQYGYGEEKARVEAARIVAVPGTSEHQTGLAIDFSSETLVKQNKYLESSFLDTQAGIWFKNNAHRFGFVLRYQEDAEPITQIMPEAWHYRYVDQPHSSLMYEQGMVLETYLDYLKEEQAIQKEIEGTGRALVIYIDNQLADKVAVDIGIVDVSDSNEGGMILTIWQ